MVLEQWEVQLLGTVENEELRNALRNNHTVDLVNFPHEICLWAIAPVICSLGCR